MSVDAEGRVYQDFYRMALENESQIETQKLLTTLKREGMAFARGLRWRTEEGWTGREGGREEGGRMEGADSSVSGGSLSLTHSSSFPPSFSFSRCAGQGSARQRCRGH